MKPSTPFVITISRQLGSGGAFIGQQLAKKMNLYYADREIISEAAKKLAVLEEDLESRDEKLLSFWKSFIHINGFSAEVHIPPQMNFPFDREIFDAETAIIERIAKERAAVIMGRCGSYILREYPNHVSIFLHGDIAFRKNRIQNLFNISEDVAANMIARNDKERARYYHEFTGKEWTDAKQYNLSIDTGKIGIDKSMELIFNYLQSESRQG